MSSPALNVLPSPQHRAQHSSHHAMDSTMWTEARASPWALCSCTGARMGTNWWAARGCPASTGTALLPGATLRPSVRVRSCSQGLRGVQVIITPSLTREGRHRTSHRDVLALAKPVRAGGGARVLLPPRKGTAEVQLVPFGGCQHG